MELRANERLRVKKSHLLRLYGILFLGWLFFCIDYFFLESRLNEKLPFTAEVLFPIAIFLNLPHIVASSVSFCDQEYLRFYKRRLLLPAGLMGVGAFLLPHLVGVGIIFFLNEIWTVRHLLGQQFGLTGLFGANRTSLFKLWYWSGVILAWIFYSGLILIPLGFPKYAMVVDYFTLQFNLALTAYYLVVSFWLYRSLTGTFSKTYLVLNVLMVASSVIFILTKYFFIFSLCFRMIHDLTAFYFYWVHDVNRNQNQIKNIVFRKLSFIQLPIHFLSPLVAIFIALPISYGVRIENWKFFLSLHLMLGWWHYYTDGFVWKGGSPQRRYVEVV